MAQDPIIIEEESTAIEFSGIKEYIPSSLLEREGFSYYFSNANIRVSFLRQQNGEFKPISAADEYGGSCWEAIKNERIKVVGEDGTADDIPI